MKRQLSVNALPLITSLAVLAGWMGLLHAQAFGQAAPNQKPEWLEGTGKDLRIRVTGEILDESGARASDSALVVNLRTQSKETSLPVTAGGGRFQFWVPVGEGSWFFLHVHARSSDGG